MASRDESARQAAESLLSGSSSSSRQLPLHPQQQIHPDSYVSTGPLYDQMYPRLVSLRGNIQSPTSPSIEFYNDELLAGLRLGGQMSGVRRFFCLFLTFDLLFTFLMWFTCIMLIGNRDVVQALIDEVTHYNVHTSMFDIVMAAACRFTVLLLFYALLYINHWIIIALSTSGTCAFLIFKVFVFNWASAGQPVFQVLIILTSFVLAWGETWFLDFRVIPQEALAQAIVIDQNAPNMFRGVYDERTPLLRNFLSSVGRPDNYTESIGNFYSPLDSPRGSDDEDESGSRYRSSSQRTRSQPLSKEAQLAAEARENFNTAWIALNSKTGWKKEKETAEGDLVESKGVAKQRKIFRLKGQIEIPPKLLLEELYYKVEDMPAWNQTIVQSRRLQVLDEHTDIVYQISAEGGGGVVTSREFVVLRHWGVKDGVYISSGCSCSHLDAPENKKLIRGQNGPNCWAMQPVPGEPNQCIFLWLLDTDLKGWVPQYMVEAALSSAMLDFLASLREYAAKLKEEGKFPAYM
ncbi:steroidogenic acute regulatory protein-like [Neocloeon triangulifer]|uniref:steroidogenic acute regulatory protein-like n=1 Tax=Neocloeon triangulifer TaxID=2078957 RepID=UPI00286F86AD|nr:steroidogenic acute regulatory protein-like [Neocloeon triangulifer]XP_059483051.1 steroidogenic acute regulatory protein-like [Neocloeon triangulifer]